MGKVLGTSIKRREDPSLITGRGKYTDDLKLDGMLHCAMVRSPYAHAKVGKIDATAALATEGVVAVYTATDADRAGMPGMIPTGWLVPGLVVPEHHMLARDTVRYVGDAVAVVVATDRYIARDAIDLVSVDYEPLPAVHDPMKAASGDHGGAVVHAEAPNNVAFDWELGMPRRLRRPSRTPLRRSRSRSATTA